MIPKQLLILTFFVTRVLANQYLPLEFVAFAAGVLIGIPIIVACCTFRRAPVTTLAGLAVWFVYCAYRIYYG